MFLAKQDGIDSFPTEFEQLLDKQYLFKVDLSEMNVKFGYRVYTVQKLCSDPNVISEFIKSYPNPQSEDHCLDGNADNSTDSVSHLKDCGSSGTACDSVRGGTSTGFSPLKKSIKQEPGTSPMSVKSKSSATKTQRSILPE
ncbi:uncharacterized protein [Rutidosis leptorrhynchoides]|uniref:uncharacterized protein isoform X2 n=1 Tax=Rutidosis leptorrhynchoides TaxID=125765 RepID=UPI003A9935B7